MSRVTSEETGLSRLAESTRAPWRYPSRMIRVESRTFYEEDPRVFRDSLGKAEGRVGSDADPRWTAMIRAEGESPARLIPSRRISPPVPGIPSPAKRILARRTALKAKYGSLYDEVLRILTKHDPIDIAEVPDEYEPEVDTILPRLEEARSASDARRAIHEEFVEWFSVGLAGPEENFEKISLEVWNAWNRHWNRR